MKVYDLSSVIPMKYFIAEKTVVRGGWMEEIERHILNRQKKAVILTGTHKTLSDRTPLSLRLIPSSTFVRFRNPAPCHSRSSGANQPFRISWIISGKQLYISEPQGKPDLWSGLIQTETGLEKSLYKQMCLGPGPPPSSCMSYVLSLS